MFYDWFKLQTCFVQIFHVTEKIFSYTLCTLRGVTHDAFLVSYVLYFENKFKISKEQPSQF